jgi:uncharacterized protein (UPF0276 family)
VPAAAALPYLGHGVGLRVPHYERALAGGLPVDWVELVTENFLGSGGRPRAVLEAVRRERPIVFHGVSLGVGSSSRPDAAYLRRVRALADAFEPAWLSDHLCWTRFEGRESHELLPLPFTDEALALTIESTERAQDALGRPLLLENVSSYVAYADSQMSEWQFLSELARRSGCFILLDLNNVVVSAFNHGFSPDEYLAGLPPERVAQFHLANHTQYPHYKFDDHRGPVPEAVWTLFEAALRRFGRVSSLIEWDEDVPAWETLVAERDRAAARAQRVLDEPTPAVAGAVATFAWPPPQEPPPPVATPRRLAHTQRLFFDALTWPRGVRDFARAAGRGRAEELARTFTGGGGLAPLERVDIYANAYFYRLLEALREFFPRLSRLAGDVPFHNLITDYVLAHPSRAPDLHRVGDSLPGFLRSHVLGQDAPLLADMAELELALARALHAADAQPLTRAELFQLAPTDWPSLRVALVPSAALISVSHDLEHAARLCDAQQIAAALVSPNVGQRVLLLHRRGHAVLFRSLPRLEALALTQLQHGARFDALCERMAEHGADAPAVLDELLRWVDDGLLVTPP